MFVSGRGEWKNPVAEVELGQNPVALVEEGEIAIYTRWSERKMFRFVTTTTVRMRKERKIKICWRKGRVLSSKISLSLERERERAGE